MDGNGVNGSLDGLSADHERERPTKRYEQQQLAVAAAPWTDPSPTRHLGSRYLAAAIILFFWVAQFASNTLYSVLNETKDIEAQLMPRAVICAAGALLSFAFIAAQNRLRRSSLGVRAAWSIVLAVAGAAVHGAINHVVFEYMMPGATGYSALWQVYSIEVLNRLWVFACLSAITLAIAYSSDIRDQEGRIQALQSLAQDVQLRALRSQLNPHFLFNALNSVSALIASDRKEAAEAITENLADFLRITLALDPHRLISLAEEIRLQKLYLEIQELRFPDRLDVEFDIPPTLDGALLPNLISQPLIENSIKYAVARSTTEVKLHVFARQIGDKLELLIEDTGGNAQGEPPVGCGLGIRNVRDRLAAHYGNRASLKAGVRPNGGFRNIISVPLTDAR